MAVWPQDGKRDLARNERLVAVQDFFERRAIHALHEDVGQPVLFGDVVDGDDVGMRKHPGRLRFAEQALAQAFALGIVGEIGQADGFDGDNPADGGILGAVNHAGRTTAELVQNPVSADLIHADTLFYQFGQMSPR